MQFITIKESRNANDLYVLKSRLESEGIFCHLKDELSSQILNYLPVMTVKLQVTEKDIERVKEIMEESGESLFDKNNLICPKCGSEKIKVKISIKNSIYILTMFFLAIITLSAVGNVFKNAEYRCKDCYHDFKDT